MAVLLQETMPAVPLPCGPCDAHDEQLFDLHAAHASSGATDFAQVITVYYLSLQKCWLVNNSYNLSSGTVSSVQEFCVCVNNHLL